MSTVRFPIGAGADALTATGTITIEWVFVG